MRSPQSEEERRFAVRQRVLREHSEDISLLEDLMLAASAQLERTDSQESSNDGRRLQLMLLTQSMNAAFCAFGLLTDGYPRMALHLARLLWEGSIAFRWFSADTTRVQ